MGTTRFHSLVEEHRRLEIGFTWIASEWQRTFVNTEAKYLMLRHAFGERGIERVDRRRTRITTMREFITVNDCFVPYSLR